ncbi:MAG: hypothetical protein QNJ90_01145 [Planctomycetota bacterium]|nr:hypothetical protein [Planctomycetota bacterium]
MSDVIQCPQCDKRFRLPENVPATFTCTGCGTLMDLSDFGGAEPEPEPVRPARSSRGGGGAPRTRTQRRKGGGRSGGRAAAGPAPSRRGRAGGRRRGRHAHDDEPHGGYAQRAQRRQGNGLLIGSLVGLGVAIILVIVMLSGKDDDTGPGDGGKKTAAKGTEGTSGAGTSSKGTPGTKKGPVKPGSKEVPVAADGTELTAPDGTGEGGEGAAPKRKRPKPVRLSRLKLEKWPWPDEVDEATRVQVEEAIQNLYRGGRDGNEAEDFLVSKGRIVCGRVISEFRAIEESPGFHDREGASRAGAIDTVLRKIDGVIERKFFEENRIRASSRPTFTLTIARRWTWWWKTEEWKNNPREPFDPFSETIEDLKSGGKDKKKKSGFGKRAGGG